MCVASCVNPSVRLRRILHVLNDPSYVGCYPANVVGQPLQLISMILLGGHV